MDQNETYRDKTLKVRRSLRLSQSDAPQLARVSRVCGLSLQGRCAFTLCCLVSDRRLTPFTFLQQHKRIFSFVLRRCGVYEQTDWNLLRTFTAATNSLRTSPRSLAPMLSLPLSCCHTRKHTALIELPSLGDERIWVRCVVVPPRCSSSGRNKMGFLFQKKLVCWVKGTTSHCLSTNLFQV